MKSPLVVSLVQITEPMLQFVNLPYAIALLQAFVKAHAPQPERYLFTLPLFERAPLAQAVNSLSLAQVAGFSLYVWNAEYSLALARELKARRPETLIVVGGPHVPDRPEEFLQRYPWVDVCVHGEGEATFLELLESFPGGDLSAVKGISYRQAGQVLTSTRPRGQNLTEIVSPFLTGVLEPLLLTYPHYRWVTAWETNRGCPFSCAFCDWGSLTRAKVQRFDMERLLAEIDWIARHRIEVVFCCDANFGIFARDLELAQAMASQRQASGFPKLFYTQAAKNSTDRVFQTQKLLFDAGLHTGATLSLQSVSEAALGAIRRENISLSAYRELQTRFRQAGVPTYTDVLVGLPGETYDSFTAGVSEMITQGQHQEMRFYNVFILPNAELAQPDYRQQHQIHSVRIPYLTQLNPVAEPVAGIGEWHEMIIAAQTFTTAQWLQMRVFAWFTELLYFSRALQVPILLLQHCGVTTYEQSLKAFAEGAWPAGLQVLPELLRFFQHKAQAITQGQPEYCVGLDPASQTQVWMGADYFALTQWLQAGAQARFYAESRQVLETLWAQRPEALPLQALQEAVNLSQQLFRSQSPEQLSFELQLNWNLWELYQAVLAGQSVQLQPGRWSFVAQQTPQGMQYQSAALTETSFSA